MHELIPLFSALISIFQIILLIKKFPSDTPKYILFNFSADDAFRELNKIYFLEERQTKERAILKEEYNDVFYIRFT